MSTTTPIKMPGTPRPWMNHAVATMLRTPGLRRMLGRTFAVLTVSGARTGRRYSTPVQYFPHGGRYLVLSQRKRTWWRNITARPHVDLLVRGETIGCDAAVAEGETAHALLSDCLAANPRVAKFYGLGIDEGGAIDPAGVDELLVHVVVIAMVPDPSPTPTEA